MRHRVVAAGLVTVAFMLPGCGGKISADKTARELQSSTSAKSVMCEPGTGGWKQYDYRCILDFDTVGSMAPQTDTLGVNVNSMGITFQTAP